MKYIVATASILLLLTGCEDKGLGTQDIDNVNGVTSTTKVKLLSSVPKSSEDIAQKSYITISFSAQMDVNSLNDKTVSLTSADGSNIATTLEVKNNYLFVRPEVSLEDGMAYTLKVDPSFKDLFGNSLEKTYSLSFTCNRDFWQRVEAGKTHSIAISKSKDIYVWGNNPLLNIMLDENNISQLIVDIPLPLPKANDPLSISSGDYTTGIITNEGSIQTNGVIGFSTFEGTDYTTISVGKNHIASLKEDGTLYSWGSNSDGQLGTLGILDKFEPTQEISESFEWSSISAGEDFTLALKNDQTMWGWGKNDYGQIGNKDFKERRQPVQEDTNSTWLHVSAGSSFSMAIKTDNTLWAWGRNDSGQLGNETNSSSKMAVKVSSDTQWKTVSAGYNHTMALSDSNKLYTWGDNTYGQVGDNSTDNKNVPTNILPTMVWSSVSAGDGFSLAVAQDGTLWSWGHNASGQLGIGLDQNDTLTPREVK